MQLQMLSDTHIHTHNATNCIVYKMHWHSSNLTLATWKSVHLFYASHVFGLARALLRLQIDFDTPSLIYTRLMSFSIFQVMFYSMHRFHIKLTVIWHIQAIPLQKAHTHTSHLMHDRILSNRIMMGRLYGAKHYKHISKQSREKKTTEISQRYL